MDNLNKNEDFDLFIPASFERALKKKIPRPFVFGPVEFDNLNKTEDQQAFEPENQRE
jgi:hypothetical protein